MKIQGVYQLTLIGDGRQSEGDLPMNVLKAPDPIVDAALPSGILSVTYKPGVEKAPVTQIPFTYDKDTGKLHLVFDIPPSAATITITALFGKD